VADHLDVDRLCIDERFSDGHGAPLDVEDPATGQVFTSVARADIGQVEAALAAAHRSHLAGTWADVPVAERVAALCGMADALVARRDELVETIIRETGSTAGLNEGGLPAGAFNVVTEAGAQGALALTTDPRVDCVSCTGSTTVGRYIAAQAAPTVKRLVLELGGKSVQLYPPDAVDNVAALSGAVYTADLRAGLGVAQRIRSGTVQVNRSAATASTPMGGVKQSGIGRERGVAGLREYQEIKHLVVAALAR
jgi:aldehyde dehydrogenase (NAD+)